MVEPKQPQIRVSRELKERLDSLKGKSELSYGAVISKYLPKQNDIWKEKLSRSFYDLQNEFPDQTAMLEFMRVIIFNSLDLPRDLQEKYNKEVVTRLNDLSHYKYELLKENEGGEAHND